MDNGCQTNGRAYAFRDMVPDTLTFLEFGEKFNLAFQTSLIQLLKTHFFKSSIICHVRFAICFLMPGAFTDDDKSLEYYF